MRYFLKLSYKGTHYFGWQIQPREISIQQCVQESLNTALHSKNIEVVGCGRTDTGVHAKEYYAHFDSPHDLLDLEKIRYRLNALLPQDIAISRIIEVHETAHARFDAIQRQYQYFIHFDKDPFSINTSVWLKKRPDIEKMNQAAVHLKTLTDFTSFAKLHSDNKTNICHISEAFWMEFGGGMVFTVSADRFLRNMVRAIVGTLLDVGFNKRSLSQFEDLIRAKNRSEAGMSAPAHGLYLSSITYPYPL